MRTFGLGLAFFCVGSVFWLHDAPLFLWGALAANGFLWPHLAKALAVRSSDPARAELRHLTLDSALGGVWVALMQFNLLPCVLLVTMLTVTKIAVGGMRFALLTTAVLVATCMLTSAAFGFAVDIETPMLVVVACIPFLIAYPLAISHVMYALSNKVVQQNRRLAQLSYTDELTGLANRRQGFAAAEHALASHRRNGGPAVLVVIDIDRFKDANDRYGHPAGDQVLRDFATLLRQCSRATDTPARYAGDEFLLVLPDTDLQGAAQMAMRIREHVAAAKFEQAPGLRSTVSLGAAEAHRDMADVEDWLQQADAALYRAKANGRDRLVSAPRIGSAHRRDLDAVGAPTADDALNTEKRLRHSVSA
jgi:diguanylate cyclase